MKDGVIIEQGTPSEIIEKFAGREVAEIEGVDDVALKALCAEAASWYLPSARAILFPSRASALAETRAA